MAGIAHTNRGVDLSEGDITEALETRDATRALLERVAEVGEPHEKIGNLFLAFAILAKTECDWLDGEPRIELVSAGDLTVIEMLTDLGGGMRERMFAPIAAPVSFAEFQQILDIAPRAIAPFVARPQRSGRLAFVLEEPSRASSVPPRSVQISEDSMCGPLPTASLPSDLSPPPGSIRISHGKSVVSRAPAPPDSSRLSPESSRLVPTVQRSAPVRPPPASSDAPVSTVAPSLQAPYAPPAARAPSPSVVVSPPSTSAPYAPPAARPPAPSGVALPSARKPMATQMGMGEPPPVVPPPAAPAPSIAEVVRAAKAARPIIPREEEPERAAPARARNAAFAPTPHAALGLPLIGPDGPMRPRVDYTDEAGAKPRAAAAPAPLAVHAPPRAAAPAPAPARAPVPVAPKPAAAAPKESMAPGAIDDEWDL